MKETLTEKSYDPTGVQERKKNCCGGDRGLLSIYNASSLAGGKGNTSSWGSYGMQPLVLALKPAQSFVVCTVQAVWRQWFLIFLNVSDDPVYQEVEVGSCSSLKTKHLYLNALQILYVMVTKNI